MIKAMADKGYNEDNIDEFLKREWDINAYLMNLPQIAEIFKELPDYSDYNHGKPNNYSLQNAKRRIEHMSGGQLVEKVSIEHGGPKIQADSTRPILWTMQPTLQQRSSTKYILNNALHCFLPKIVNS